MAKGNVEPVVDYKDIKAKLPKAFAALVKEQGEINADIKVLKDRHGELGEILCAGMIAAKAKKVAVGDFVITQSTGHSSKIDGQKLLQHGVASDVIVACTVTGSYEYVSVKVKGVSNGLVE